MKKDIKPKWEHPENKKGGCLSYKMETKCKVEIHRVFLDICAQFVNESISDKDEFINGISLVIKKNHIILKLWLKEVNFPIVFSEDFKKNIGVKNIQKGIKQAHQSNIKRDYRKNTVYNLGNRSRSGNRFQKR
tara:strand:+ start:2759 stop:3157 length:399 start_codon:yes stop_codon:yes gene_type:complete